MRRLQKKCMVCEMAVGRRGENKNEFQWKKPDNDFEGHRGDDDLGHRGDHGDIGWHGIAKNYVFGRDGKAFLESGFDHDWLRGLRGDDHIVGTDGFDWLWGRRGDDHIEGGGGNDWLSGGRGDDHLEGGDGNDWLSGGRGDDELFGGDGNDRLFGGRGDDVIEGGAGNDRGHGGRGEDTLNGGAGDDWLFGGRDDDIVFGGDDNDRLFGGRGEDRIEGGDGDDKLYGGRDDDTLLGGDGADYLYGGKGDDSLAGGIGADTLIGGLGADTFVFGALSVVEIVDPVEINVKQGNILPNRLVGSDGSDLLRGDGSDDTLTGGEGRDIFAYGSVHEAFGRETITDFTPGADGDILDFESLFRSHLQQDDPDPLGTLTGNSATGAPAVLAFTDQNGGTLISVVNVGPGTNGELKSFVFLRGVESASLTRDNFKFGIDNDPVIGGKVTRTVEAPEGGDVIVDFDIEFDALDFRAVVESLGVADDPFGEDGIAVTQMDGDTVITVGGIEDPFVTLANVDADELTDENWVFA
jgi:hypothetical protein